MNIIILLIFIGIITKGTNQDRRRSDIFKKIILGYVGISLLAGLLSSGGFVSIAVIGFLIWYFTRKKQKSEKTRWEEWQESYEKGKRNAANSQNSYGNSGGSYSGNSSRGFSGNSGGNFSGNFSGSFSGGQRASGGRSENAANGAGAGRFSQTQPDPMSRVESVLLARPIAKRKKVIAEFNGRYDLTLTDAEVQRIAEASYVSEGWKREVEAMTQKYDTVGQWFQGPTGWLRVYIYVFQIQNISSDFGMQEQICIEALDEVVAYGCGPEGLSIDERVSLINKRYFTCFDEMSFMVAWRFLQQRGREHRMSGPDLVKNVDSDLEELERKYRDGV
ncbi:MAG: hypothetical protein LUC90_11355 [Lachnospiraceae bacterium]|nr:hypothetical protein [Lachnospiraceae bacterium]